VKDATEEGSIETMFLLLCCNPNGSEKLKPSVVGKFEKP
jgi:hypothetical protein